MAGKAAAKLARTLSGDEKTGADIVAKALLAPISQIAANAGVEGAVVLEKVSASRSASFGYDAANEKYGDMIEMGIVDPTKVCRSALENAASVSAMVLTTESLVADIPEKGRPGSRPGPGYVLIPTPAHNKAAGSARAGRLCAFFPLCARGGGHIYIILSLAKSRGGGIIPFAILMGLEGYYETRSGYGYVLGAAGGEAAYFRDTADVLGPFCSSSSTRRTS